MNGRHAFALPLRDSRMVQVPGALAIDVRSLTRRFGALAAVDLVQTGVIYGLAAVMHLPLAYAPRPVAAVLAIVVLGSALFSTFSLIIACIAKTRERSMRIGQVLTMPLFFASSAIDPQDLMPEWLRVVALFNPLTYLVDALRALMVPGSSTAALGVDVVVTAGIFALLLALAVRVQPVLVC
jgi:ABC-2 type transport system permease protein